MKHQKYLQERNCKIVGSVAEAGKSIDAKHLSAGTVNIKASTYDLSLRNKDLLEQYADVYHISSNIHDYIFIPVPIFITNIPNRNGITFIDEEVDTFYDDIGQYMFQTWIGKPCFVEHDDSDETQSKGIIFDAVIRPLPQFNLRQCWVLWGLDRTKDVDFTKEVLDAKHNYFSMGARANYFTCSFCGHKFTSKPHCPCLNGFPYMHEANGEIACANARQIIGTEVSRVADPAWVSAEADNMLEVE